MSLPKLSLVICTLDEAEAIGPVIREARTRLARIPHEVLVVDDSAGDATAEVVRALAAADPAVRLIRRPGARGLASAAIAGWDAACGEVLGLMDGDGQHDPAVVARLVRVLEGGDADLAVASRYVPGQAVTGLAGFRDRLSRLGTGLTHLALGAPLSDPLSGCFVMRRAWYAAARPRLSGVGFKVLADLAVSGGRRPRVAEAPTALRARLGGDSKLDLRVLLELLAQLLERRTGGLAPARFALFAGVGATGLVVHMGVLAAWRAALGSAPAGDGFLGSQAAAILVAMSWNFWLNNALTFRDARLKGAAAWRGLLAFSAACAVGAAISEAVGEALHLLGAPWLLAGVSGPVAAAVWNYRTAKGAWRPPEEPQAVEDTPRPAALPGRVAA
jgi:dolichol-phosphate mannosyltransferase